MFWIYLSVYFAVAGFTAGFLSIRFDIKDNEGAFIIIMASLFWPVLIFIIIGRWIGKRTA